MLCENPTQEFILNERCELGRTSIVHNRSESILTSTVYQVSTPTALVEGVYQGAVRVGTHTLTTGICMAEIIAYP